MELQKDFVPIKYTVSHVYFISRQNDDPFQIIKSIPLGTEIMTSEMKAVELNKVIISSEKLNKESLSFDKLEESLSADPNLDAYADKDLPLVAQRVIKWLVAQSERKKLPKTRDKFRASIKNMCVVTFRAISAKEIFTILKNERYFSVDKNRHIKYKSKPTLTPASETNLTEVQLTLLRCKKWLFSDKNCPKTEDNLMNCLEQLAALRRSVNQDDLLSFLENKGKIKFVGYDGIEYPGIDLKEK